MCQAGGTSAARVKYEQAIKSMEWSSGRGPRRALHCSARFWWAPQRLQQHEHCLSKQQSSVACPQQVRHTGGTASSPSHLGSPTQHSCLQRTTLVSLCLLTCAVLHGCASLERSTLPLFFLVGGRVVRLAAGALYRALRPKRLEGSIR